MFKQLLPYVAMFSSVAKTDSGLSATTKYIVDSLSSAAIIAKSSEILFPEALSSVSPLLFAGINKLPNGDFILSYISSAALSGRFDDVLSFLSEYPGASKFLFAHLVDGGKLPKVDQVSLKPPSLSDEEIEEKAKSFSQEVPNYVKSLLTQVVVDTAVK